jgi:hypothetical protein
MSKNTDEAVIKLHTDCFGSVWFSRGIEAPQSSGKSVDTFTLSSMCSARSAVFRILGVPQNAELLCTLFLRVRQREIHAVELAGSNVFSDKFSTLTAQQVMMRMNGVYAAPSCGGWREMTAADYNMYALIARFLRNNYVFDSSARIHFASHPIAKLMAFIPTLSESDAAWVIATIVDPRWFVDRRKTEALKNVFFYLGLTPAVQTRVSDKTCLLSKSRELRCARVLAAWKSQDVLPEKIDLQNPANFLYRIRAAAGGGAKGDLRASQAFIHYVVSNWVAATDRRSGFRDGLFAADLYFKTPTEQTAYKQFAEAAMR